ncbi:MAG: hypothetical protein E5Y63_31555 [Mesorhizobium sp.]|uniref:hypothetical protein n=1 Tax=Mesorhizobium sp. TaxID=1871066 RepID=UPI0011FEF5DF|nr:hypothetical protein [Mesorhizobium sp.]TIM26036.1 MAG: hypothetical protein E5Y63_31555 [Mesorhizobium sp.]
MDLSLVISVLALLISIFVTGWTVYRDVIQKPRFRVTTSVKHVYQQHQALIGPDFWVEALNMGPSPNRVGLVFARPSWFNRKFRKAKSAFIAHDHTHLGSTAKGQRVEVGDTVGFVFPLRGEFLSGNFAQMGVADGFGRIHWASGKSFRAAAADARKHLPPAPETLVQTLG